MQTVLVAYKRRSPEVQLHTIPVALSGGDVIVQAKSGTGRGQRTSCSFHKIGLSFLWISLALGGFVVLSSLTRPDTVQMFDS